VNTTEITSLVSVLIASMALIVSAKAYLKQYKEDLKISSFKSRRPYKIAYTIKSKDDPKQQLYLVTEWECVIINNGHNTVAITNFRVPEHEKFNVIEFPDKIYKIKIATTETESWGEIIQVYKNVYTLSPDEEIPLPIEIEPGKSARFKIKIGLPIHRKCQEMVQEELNADRIGDNTLEIFSFLQQNKLTIFGPMIIDKFVPITFKTSKGNYFHDLVFFNKDEVF
jgi:hypothetical protein